MRSRSLLLVAVLGCLCACGPSTARDASHAAPECETIFLACHAADLTRAAARECHDFADNPATTGPQCAARRDECLAACAPVDAGASGDGSSDAAADTGGDIAPHDGH